MAPLSHRTIGIPTRDGGTLQGSYFEADHGRRTGDALLVLSAMGAGRARYAPFAQDAREAGWSVLTFDYRGIGASSPGELPASLTSWGGEDVAAAIDWLDHAAKPRRLFAVAHSIGGHLLALAPNHTLLERVALVSTPRHQWWRFARPYRYLVYTYFQLAVPILVRSTGKLPMPWTGLHAIPARAAREWAAASLEAEPFEHPELRSLAEAFDAFQAPALAIGFDDDRFIAPPEAVRAILDSFYARSVRAHCQVRPGPSNPIGHSGYFDGAVPTHWWRDTRSWLVGGAVPESARSRPGGLFSHLVDERPRPAAFRVAGPAPRNLGNLGNLGGHPWLP